MTSIGKPVNGKLLVKQETHSHIREKGRERKKKYCQVHFSETTNRTPNRGSKKRCEGRST